MVAALRDGGVPTRRLMVPTVDQVIAAHSMLLSAVNDATVTNFGPELAASVASAGRRKIGTAGGWGFQSVDGGDVTLAESVVLAHYGAVTAKRRQRTGDRQRRAVVV